ncbi:MAG: hypothetical protein OWQ54_08020 [Sulfolobaceae archaeon]|nr:hypothetical protein [Sulfolobaceae archaeon]
MQISRQSTNKKKTHRKAISSIMGTIIVLAITLALGGLLYAYTQGLFNNLTQNVNVVTQYNLIVNPASSQAYLEVNLQNNGNIRVNVTSISIISGNSNFTYNFKDLVLQPGQTYQTIIPINSSISITAGNYYTVILTGVLPNGKPYTSVQNVLASTSS